MAVTVSSVAEVCERARSASRALAACDTATKNAALRAIAAALRAREDEILAANELDLQAGREADIGSALLDRLGLDAERLEGIAAAVEAVAALGDPVGEVIDGQRLPNGLDVRKVRVPLGVVAVVYEARPNVTIDAAVLCLKSGNAIVLRGSSSAAHSNAILATIASEAAVSAGLPDGCIGLVAGGGREELAELATQEGVVDLLIPRGGEGLKAALKDVATVPVIYAASGNCHVYVDASADLDVAREIVMNAKTQRPGVCNAAETLLVHRQVADEVLQGLLPALASAGVEVRADGPVWECAQRLAQSLEEDGDAERIQAIRGSVRSATDADWGTEYLALTLAVGVVHSVEDAIEHIARHGSGHSEAIVTNDTASARAFQLGVDAACVYVNASTRFTDGGEFGMGAEIGNSTQKLHARGPIGLRELCTFKYLVEGSGHVRV
ncbi:MAG TPA: glutamate-5-semialdehyde dehydrogenase [Solirubrobacteraceae bacterium]|jgi:glutamate-5-semialdehyde dehydrogenase|nr:glutamate-5-semialdehyde dehydrogenase [Solirubrobacteraceae bacterium]